MSLLPAAVFLPGSPGQQPVMGGIPNSQFSVPVNVEATFLPLPPPPHLSTLLLLGGMWAGLGGVRLLGPEAIAPGESPWPWSWGPEL